MLLHGSPVHGEVVSSNASAGVEFDIYRSGDGSKWDGAAGNADVGSNEFLVITDISIVAQSGGNVAIVANTDAAGFRVFKGNVTTNGGVVIAFQTPHWCPKGITPKLIADSGNIVAIIHGFIRQA